MDIRSDFHALSQPQQSIWYLEQKYPGTCMNVIAGTLRFKGEVDYDALTEAIRLLIKNNDGLRIHFRETEGEVREYLTSYEEKHIDFLDFSRGQGFEDLFRWDEEETHIPFELIDSDLYYFAVLKIDGNNWGFYAKLHHLISDAWTMSIIGNEVMRYYELLKKNIPVEEAKRPSFFEHLANEEKYEQSERFARDKEYWNEKFDEYPEPTVLKPQALNDKNIMSSRKTFVAPQKLSRKIREYCSEHNTSVFTLFLSALSIYINRVTGIEDIIMGTTILNRINSREKDTIGMFVSVAAPIRIRMDNTRNFTEFSGDMAKESLAILKHQKYPYNYLIRDLKRKHKVTGRLFDIVLNYQNSKFSNQKTEGGNVSRWHFSGYQVESLVIHVNDRDDEGNFVIDYDYLNEVFNVKEIEYIHQHVISLLWHALDNPLRPVARLEMLSEKEKHQILDEFNNTAVDFPRDRTLQDFLYAQAAETPDNTAVIFKQGRMTYREVNEKSNQLARVLRDKGVTADTVVGISLFRSFEMIIGIMAILKAGGAYLPMDPNYPCDRIRYMMEDSGAHILLTQSALTDRFAFDADITAIDDAGLYTADSSDLDNSSGPHNLAYIIYTSGSTGKPKGVMIEHAGVINRLNWASGKYPIDESDIMLQKTPFTFDVSVWELFWWTFAGASVCMLEPGGERDPETILKTVEENRISLIHFVPSMLAAFLSYTDMTACAGRMATVKRYFSSGEALTIRLTDAFNRILNKPFGAELHNLYGPTEATVEVSYFDCSPKVTLKTVPIGRPIDNIRLYVMDKNRILLPVGIPGELYIGGVGVARGYINNPDLTAEKFLPDPYYPGERIYKTGDRVRWFPKGDIEYLGRMDFQVKIRGFRIELGEIESRMMKHPAIREAVVVGRMHNSNTYLCAYFTAKKKVRISEVKDFLAKDLPDYMIPAFFEELDEMPLSTNGKADRKALPAPDFSNIGEVEFTEPANETEARLADLWCTMLRLDKVSVTESFFHLGGDSLHAITLITELHRKFNVDMPVSEVFRLKTIRKISEFVLNAETNQYLSIPPLEKQPGYEMSSAQKRMYVLHQLDAADLSYNLPGAMRIEGDIDPDRLETAFAALIERHESLRTSFALENGSLVQNIHDGADFSIENIACGEQTADEAIRNFVRPFDLGRAPLFRVGLLTLDNGARFLLFDMHHIISDGASINILVRDLSALYSSKGLPELKIQYKDFAAWQAKRMNDTSIRSKEDYWLNLFAGEIPILNLPTDFTRPARKSFRGRKASVSINGDVPQRLKKLSDSTGTTLCMVMMGAYDVLLSKYCSQEDIIVGMPVEGRLNADVKDLIGMFVNTAAIRSTPSADKTFLQFLQEVKGTLLAAFENQEYPFEELVDKVGAKRDLGRNPLFDTVFILQNMDISRIELGGAVLTPYAFDSGTSKFDITVEAYDRGDTIELTAEYCSDLFEETTVRRFLSHYAAILADIVLDPGKRIADINMLSQVERQQLLTDFNRTDASFPRNMIIQQIFEEQAERSPDRIAVSFRGESVTYRELNTKANQMAWILREKGIGPDDIVGLCISRSIDMIAGILAVLKSGGAYLPMDPDYPVSRNRYIMQDSGAKLLLTEDEFLAEWKDEADAVSVQDKRIQEMSPENPGRVNTPGDLAYIIYTSGSTGKPKGVMIEHANVVRLLFNDKFQFAFSNEDVWTMFHSYCFDFSVWEMYGALLYGGRLVVVSREDARDTEKFYDIVRKEKVTVLNQTPGAFYNLIRKDLDTEGDGISPRYVIFGGEALKPIMLKPFHERHPDTRLINMYGITETTVHVTYKEIGREEIDLNISNVGKAIPTLRTYITDKNLNLLPVGVPGELCVSGAGVGRGYLHNEETTRQKFVPSPFCPGERLYRSGDLARVRPDGDIEYLGRIDSQVKIRGYRIELGEIESAMLRHPGIRETVVVPRENQAGDKRLFAYYVSDGTISHDDLCITLKKTLPDYMIPSLFIHLDKMPLNRNGKIDRASLPQNIEAAAQQDYIEPIDGAEKMIACIWADVLELSKVGRADNFFALGGDSLSAIRVIAKLNENNCPVSLVELYNNPTVEQLAAEIRSETGADADKLLIRLTPARKSSKINIICFPYGGGNAISYKHLGDAVSVISPDYSLYAVNVPGHDIGAKEDLLPVENVAEMVFSDIRESIDGRFVLYGHCVGNALLVETAILMEQAGMDLHTVFFGAIFPPKHVRLYGSFFDPWMLRSDTGIISYLNGIGLPGTSMQNEYADFIIKAFRHDARSYYRYFYKYSKKRLPRIKAQCLCIVGEHDAITKNYMTKYHEWENCCADVKLHVIKDADHYFINSHAGDLAEIICEEVSRQEIQQ